MRKRITRKYPMSDAMLVLFVRLMITRLIRDLAVLGAKFGLTNAKLTELGTECTAFDEMPVDTDERADQSDREQPLQKLEHRVSSDVRAEAQAV